MYYGRAEAAVLERRHARRLAAYAEHPERFPNGPPKRQMLAPATYINPPRHTPEPVVAVDEQHAATPGGSLASQRPAQAA